MLHGHHYQNAYITRDIKKAIARFAKQAEIPEFGIYEAPQVLTTAYGGVGPALMKLALVWIDDVQYEFIEPVSGNVKLYAEALPDDDSLKFHHVAARVDNWDSFRERVAREGLKVAQEGEGGGGSLKFLYIDFRDLLGHYVEYVWAVPERWAQMGAPWAR